MTKKALKKEASSRNEISPKDIPDDVEVFVNDCLKCNKVVVFLDPEDSFSKRALASLRRSGVAPKKLTTVVITGTDREDDIRDCFLNVSDGRSVPRCFIGGKFIGGAGDLEFLEMTGDLQKSLKTCGAFKKSKY